MRHPCQTLAASHGDELLPRVRAPVARSAGGDCIGARSGESPLGCRHSGIRTHRERPSRSRLELLAGFRRHHGAIRRLGWLSPLAVRSCEMRGLPSNRAVCQSTYLRNHPWQLTQFCIGCLTPSSFRFRGQPPVSSAAERHRQASRAARRCSTEYWQSWKQ